MLEQFVQQQKRDSLTALESPVDRVALKSIMAYHNTSCSSPQEGLPGTCVGEGYRHVSAQPCVLLCLSVLSYDFQEESAPI